MIDGGVEGADPRSAHLPVLHLPVMSAQVMEGLRVMKDGTYLDGTFGRGGHARGLLERLGAGGRLLLMDKDPEAIACAERDLGGDLRVAIRRGSFAELDAWRETDAGLDGVLLDLGVSSPQLDDAARGFSFGRDGPLDMRMDPDTGESAADWLARASEQEIAEVLWTYGEERMSRRIAHAILARRAQRPLARTAELAELITAVAGRGHGGIHPATRSFQAIRIHLNGELTDLQTGLQAAHARLKPSGRLAVISFHSLEDRIVKRFVTAHAKAPPTNRRLPQIAGFVPSLRAIGGARKADADEVAGNPRARSAVLRVAERLGIGNGESGIGRLGIGNGESGIDKDGDGRLAGPGRRGAASAASRAAGSCSYRFPIPHSRFPACEARP